MLKTPSVITRIVRSRIGRAHVASARCGSASMSACGKILRSAFVRRMPSMMAGVVQGIADDRRALGEPGSGSRRCWRCTPDWKVRTASVCLNVCEARFELLVEAHRAGDRPHRSGPRRRTARPRRAQPAAARMGVEAEVVVASRGVMTSRPSMMQRLFCSLWTTRRRRYSPFAFSSSISASRNARGLRARARAGASVMVSSIGRPGRPAVVTG